MPSANNIIQLRQMLSEKFPGLRISLDEKPAIQKFWPTGLRQMDEPLRGGLPKGALTEIVGKKSGSAMLLRELITHAAAENKIAALIDGNDSFDITQLEEGILSRLLWLRCRTADEAVNSADLILRDGNLPLVLLDLKFNPEKQLRKIPATTWYRFQRLMEETAAVCAIFTPHPMISPAQARIILHSQFVLADLECDTEELLRELKMDVSHARQSSELGELFQTSA